LRRATRARGVADAAPSPTEPRVEIIEFDGLKVYVDAMSGMYLDGVKIDYVDSLDGSGFKIDNPNASGTCGCGHSFQA